MSAARAGAPRTATLQRDAPDAAPHSQPSAPTRTPHVHDVHSGSTPDETTLRSAAHAPQEIPSTILLLQQQQQRQQRQLIDEHSDAPQPKRPRGQRRGKNLRRHPTSPHPQTHTTSHTHTTHMAQGAPHAAQGAPHMAQGAPHMAQGAPHTAQGAPHIHHHHHHHHLPSQPQPPPPPPPATSTVHAAAAAAAMVTTTRAAAATAATAARTVAAASAIAIRAASRRPPPHPTTGKSATPPLAAAHPADPLDRSLALARGTPRVHAFADPTPSAARERSAALFAAASIQCYLCRTRFLPPASFSGRLNLCPACLSVARAHTAVRNHPDHWNPAAGTLPH